MKQFRLTSAKAMIIGLTMVLASCGSDPIPVPTVNFVAAVSGYDANITVEATNATTFTWEYGDGNTSTETGNHKHTYAQSGDYKIKVTVTNESGSATKSVDVSISASMTELLAGTTGKTWMLDAESATSVQKITSDLTPLWAGLPGDALAAFALEAEYDNEFTFKPNGGYAIDAKNGAVLTGIVFAEWNGLDIIVEPSSNAGGMTGAAFTSPTNGTYTLFENTDLVMSVANEDYPNGTNNDGVTTATFPKANYLDFSEGSFLGIQDFTTKVMIRNISKTKMDVTIFLSSLSPATYPKATFTLPSIAISTSLIVKP